MKKTETGLGASLKDWTERIKKNFQRQRRKISKKLEEIKKIIPVAKTKGGKHEQEQK